MVVTVVLAYLLCARDRLVRDRSSEQRARPLLPFGGCVMGVFGGFRFREQQRVRRRTGGAAAALRLAIGASSVRDIVTRHMPGRAVHLHVWRCWGQTAKYLRVPYRRLDYSRVAYSAP